MQIINVFIRKSIYHVISFLCICILQVEYVWETNKYARTNIVKAYQLTSTVEVEWYTSLSSSKPLLATAAPALLFVEKMDQNPPVIAFKFF